MIQNFFLFGGVQIILRVGYRVEIVFYIMLCHLLIYTNMTMCLYFSCLYSTTMSLYYTFCYLIYGIVNNLKKYYLLESLDHEKHPMHFYTK